MDDDCPVISLTRVKKIVGEPIVIIEDERDIDSCPTLPAHIRLVPCEACSKDFGKGHCGVCGNLRMVHTLIAQE